MPFDVGTPRKTPAVTRRVGASLLAALSFFFAGPASSGVLFFANDVVAFTAAMAASGNVLIGTETFEESTQGPANATAFDDPLTQGVPNGPYPVGLLQPMTGQANQSGGTAVAPNARGTRGLAAVSAGFAGATSDAVVANFLSDSLDWIFGPATPIAGLGLRTVSFVSSSTIEVEVYDTSNALLGATTIGGDPAGTNFLGIQTTSGDLIGRVNFFSTTDQAEGGDDAMLFKPAVVHVPEPGAIALLLIGLAGIVTTRRHKM